MIKCYFGVPGCGKSTLLAKVGVKELKKLKKRYDDIYTINIEIEGCIPIKYDIIKSFKFRKVLVLIDEITMNADSRTFKSFTAEERDFFILHRHMECDIIYATQNFENVDKKVRDLTAELWYMEKSPVPLLDLFTTAKRIYRKININEFTSELTLGYRFCNFLELIFQSNMEITFRPKWYKYFDSWDELSLKERPLFIPDEEKRIKRKPTRLERFLENGKRNKNRNNRETNIINYLNDSNNH